jgi:hypothetical protein
MTYGIIQYNCGNANNETAKARPFFDSISPRQFPLLAIQEPMIREDGHTYIPKNFRTTRVPKYGMKVLFMVHDKIPMVDWTVREATDEMEWIRIRLGAETINVINVYCRPGAVSRETIQGWETIVQWVDRLAGENCLLIGDFNCHHPAWGGPGVTRERCAESLLQRMELAGLSLLNEEGVPTWKRGNRRTTIDLGFASEDVLGRVTRYYPQEDWTTMEDHFPIEIQISGTQPRTRQSSRFAIREAPWKAIKQRVVDAGWDRNEDSKLMEGLQTAIGDALEALCPKVKPSDWARPDWSPQAAEYLAGARRARRRYRSSGDPVDRREWKSAQNSLKREIRKNGRTRWRQFMEEITQDDNGPNKHKGLWKMSKWSRKAGKGGVTVIPPLRETVNDPLRDTDEEKAEVLATKFFPRSGQADLRDVGNEEFPRFHMDHEVLEETVLATLRGLPSGKAPGPDRIPNEALKQLKKEIAPGLAKAITHIFNTGKIPTCLKQSTTVVLRKDKKSDYSLPSSYRPIALENTLAKVVEKILATRMMTEAEERGLIPWNQMGARKQRSTLSALELLSGTIQTAWKAKKAVVSVLGLDIAGAYDNVSHGRLLWVLQKMGFPEWLVQVVRSFLIERRTRITYADYISRWFDTETGIPQGSTLSPALFIIFLSELLEQFKTVSGDVLGFGFVDDTTLITWGDSATVNCQRLTNAHDKCVAWAKRFGAVFAPDKYQVIHFTKKKRITEDLRSTVTIRGQDAERVDSLRVLGVWLDPTLSWKDHIRRAVQKGHSAFESMARITTSVWGPSVRKSRLIYTAIARPVMMNGSQVWAARPGQEVSMTNKLKPLATIQNKCLRKVMGAYKRTPVAAIEREAEVPPLDLHIKSQTARWAATTASAPVTRDINDALKAVWKAASRRRQPARGRRPAPAGPAPRSTLNEVREAVRAIETTSAARIAAETSRGPVRQRTMQIRSTGTLIDSHFADVWRQRWEAEAEKRQNQRAKTWHSSWKLRPLALYGDRPKHEATALFLLRTEVLGINAWLATVIPDYSPACGCGAPRQTLGHLLSFCPDTTQALVRFLNSTGSSDLRGHLDDKEKVGAAARWLLDTGVLGQFKVAVEIEEEEVGTWRPFEALQDVSI